MSEWVGGRQVVDLEWEGFQECLRTVCVDNVVCVLIYMYSRVVCGEVVSAVSKQR